MKKESPKKKRLPKQQLSSLPKFQWRYVIPSLSSGISVFILCGVIVYSQFVLGQFRTSMENLRNDFQDFSRDLKNELLNTENELSVKMILDKHGQKLSEITKRRLAKNIVRLGKKYGIEPSLLLAVIHTESRFDPKAVSSAGALGLMQILPSTGKWLAKKMEFKLPNAALLHDPLININVGAFYLFMLNEKFGQTKTALSAYWMGPGAVQKRLSSGRGIPLSYAHKVLRTQKRFDRYLGTNKEQFARILWHELWTKCRSE